MTRELIQGNQALHPASLAAVAASASPLELTRACQRRPLQPPCRALGPTQPCCSASASSGSHGSVGSTTAAAPQQQVSSECCFFGMFFGTAAGAVFTSPSSGTAAGALNAQHPCGTARICSILLVSLPYVPGHISRPTGRITLTAGRRWYLNTKHCMTVTCICRLLNSDRSIIPNGNTASDVCQKAPGPIAVIQLAD